MNLVSSYFVSSLFIIETFSVIFGVILFLVIAMALASYLAMMKAIGRRKVPPIEVLETLPDTAWSHFREDINKGIEFVNTLSWENVSVKSFDGLRLCGRLTDQANARATIIMFHGYRSLGLGDFSCATKFYYSLGFNILIVDQRSHGESEGKYIGFGALERYDCKTWADFVRDRYSTQLPIFITGLSMGGASVLMASSLDMPKNLLAIISDSAFTSPDEIISLVIKKHYHINPKIILPFMDLWARALAKYSFYGVSAEKEVQNTSIPCFFIHGLDDTFVPCEMSERAFKACVSEKAAVFVENADHGESYLVDNKKCEGELKKFIDKVFESYDRQKT